MDDKATLPFAVGCGGFGKVPALVEGVDEALMD